MKCSLEQVQFSQTACSTPVGGTWKSTITSNMDISDLDDFWCLFSFGVGSVQSDIS